MKQENVHVVGRYGNSSNPSPLVVAVVLSAGLGRRLHFINTCSMNE